MDGSCVGLLASGRSLSSASRRWSVGTIKIVVGVLLTGSWGWLPSLYWRGGPLRHKLRIPRHPASDSTRRRPRIPRDPGRLFQ